MARATPDFCWEGRLACTIVLSVILVVFNWLRSAALKDLSVPKWGPRHISGLCIWAATLVLCTYTALVCWNYTVWENIRGMFEEGMKTQNDDLLEALKRSIPDSRKQFGFAMRMMLVTVLWLVKASFVAVYYEFCRCLSKSVRMFLHIVCGIIVVTYVIIWIVVGLYFKKALEREGYSPVAGSGIVLLAPVNSWGGFVGMPRSEVVTNLLVPEIVISSFNALTDLLLLSLVGVIVRQLNLAKGRVQFRAISLMMGLSMFTISLALVRVGLINGMADINYRLAFDTLTDFEAFLAGCCACIPACRVLIRDGSRNRTVFGVVEGWGTLDSIKRPFQRFSASVSENERKRWSKPADELSSRDARKQPYDIEMTPLQREWDRLARFEGLEAPEPPPARHDGGHPRTMSFR